VILLGLFRYDGELAPFDERFIFLGIHNRCYFHLEVSNIDFDVTALGAYRTHASPPVHA